MKNQKESRTRTSNQRARVDVDHRDWQRVEQNRLSLAGSIIFAKYIAEMRKNKSVYLHDIDIISHVPRLAPNIALLSRCDDGDYFYNLVGEGINSRLKMSIHRKKLSEITFGEFDNSLQILYGEIFNEKNSVFMKGYYVDGDADSLYAEASLIPLLSKSQNCVRILVNMSYKNE